MTTAPTYTLIVRDRAGYPVNTVTGLSQDRASMAADVLRGGDGPGTFEILKELTREEQLGECVSDWLRSGRTLTTADEVVACLLHVAERLTELGDSPIPETVFEVRLQVTGYATKSTNAEKRAAVDTLAALWCKDAAEHEGGQYQAKLGGVCGGLRVVTVVRPEESAVIADVPGELAGAVA